MTNMYQDVFAGSISCQKTSLYRVNSNDKKKKDTNSKKNIYDKEKSSSNRVGNCFGKQLQEKCFGVIILKCLNVNSSTTSVGKRTNAQGGEYLTEMGEQPCLCTQRQ